MCDVHGSYLEGLGSYTTKVCILGTHTGIWFFIWNKHYAYFYCCHDPDGYVSYAASASCLSYKTCVYTARVREIIFAVSIRMTFIPVLLNQVQQFLSYCIWIWTEVWIPYTCKSLLYSCVLNWTILHIWTSLPAVHVQIPNHSIKKTPNQPTNQNPKNPNITTFLFSASVST